MNKFECISSFITVIEENGFAAAARKLKVSTAAISRQVTSLEQALGVQLLHRTTRRLELTEIGSEYYQQCKKTLTSLQEAEEAVLGSQKEAKGLLHVLSNRFFCEKYILPRIHEFMNNNPKLKIKLSVEERFPDLNSEGIDLILGVSLEGPPDLVRRKIATTRYVLCASPEYLKKHGTPKSPADLSKYHYITHTMRLPDNVVTFDNEQKAQVDPVLYVNDTRTMRECALQGMGIIRLHEYMVEEDIANKKLIEILPKYDLTKLSVYLYYQKSRYLQPKIRKFIDFFIENIK
jgi:DNA-binding transcriptional LysR family regulator